MKSIFKKNNLWIGLPILAIALTVAAVGCGTTDDASTSSPESASEIAGASVAGSANASSSTGTVSFNENTGEDRFSRLGELLIANATAANPACPTLASASCNGTTLTLTYNSCSFGSSTATWTGSQVLTFTTGVCTTTPEASAVTFTRTFGTGSSRIGANGVTVAIDTASPSGYTSTKVSGGTTIVSNGTTNRNFTINGIHYTATKSVTLKTGTAKTITVWDHSVSSGTVPGTSNLNFPGGKTGAVGPITVQHNLLQYTATATITSPLVFTASCCHPTGGTITTTLAGSLTGNESITYNPTCGSAYYTSPGGISTTITLNHCL